MDPELHRLVVDRLIDSGPSNPAAEGLVLAAAAGPEVLDQTLRGEMAATTAATALAAPPPAAGGVFIDSITVEGFRGVGGAASLRLAPFPSLTLVVGRNGSGKSSFAEALELLLTGSNRRWEGRSQIWVEGWRNLHHTPTRIAADLIAEGRSGRLRLERVWADGTPVTGGTTTVSGAGSGATLESLGWRGALASHRPFLPHNELGGLWDEGPTKLHDALAAILGLEDLTALVTTLAAARLARERAAKSVDDAVPALRELLRSVDDDRARTCLAAIEKKPWKLDVLDATLDGDAGGPPPADIGLLRELAALPHPGRDTVAELAAGLREAARRLAAIEATDAGLARTTATLLAAALEHVASHPSDTCPVCGTAGAIDAGWRGRTLTEIERLRTLAADADRVHADAGRARQLAMGVIGRMPAALLDAARVGLDGAAVRAAWSAWAGVDGSADLDALAAHLETAIAPLEAATLALRVTALAELERREDLWRPVVRPARDWLTAARTAVEEALPVPALRAAETWVKTEEQRLRAERFAPIAAAVQANWTTLRQDSSVALGELRLEGTRTTRRLSLDVSIDGAPGQALGVMSQGELNALALSLFLPRASLPESPFRFIVIDDPVQAMDPSKVDGLARVLERAASTHQVVVFTHDERLPAAVRRLDIEATVVEVVRRESSVVELRESLDPVRRHIDDALAVANTDELPVAAGRVVPMFCRLALEAACSEVVIRRRLSKGQRLAEIETALAQSQTLTGFMALALHDDRSRGSDVISALNNRFGQWAIGVYQRCNRGAHDEDGGDLKYLCREAEKLAKRLIELR